MADALLLRHAVPVARVPLSTYRLQFHKDFSLADARAVVDYVHDLGISDCYASSYLKAVPRPLRDVLTGATVEPVRIGDGYALPAAVIFERFPVALLLPADPPDLSGPR